MTSERNLPPHWLAADDQIRADLRESQRQGRESQERMWRRAGYSESQVAAKMQQHDERVAAMHEAVQSGVEDRSPTTTGRSATSSPPPEHGAPPPTPVPEQESQVHRRPPQEPVSAEFEPLPGRASRWLTGYWRYGVGVVAGTAVALVAWILLQLAGAAWLGMTVWSWPSMLLAGILPAIGLLWWIGEVHREVQHYIDFAGRVPVRFRRW